MCLLFYKKNGRFAVKTFKPVIKVKYDREKEYSERRRKADVHM